MTDDLVARLHGPVQWGHMCLADGGFIADDTPIEAAARIEALEAENRKLREVLRGTQKVACNDWCNPGKHIEECEAARAALTDPRHD